MLYGQLDDGVAHLGLGDRLEGGTGNDAMLGDLATVAERRRSTFGAHDADHQGQADQRAGLRREHHLPETYVPRVRPRSAARTWRSAVPVTMAFSWAPAPTSPTATPGRHALRR